VLGILSKWEKLNWRSLVKSSQTRTSLWCIGQCPVPGWRPRWTGRSREEARVPRLQFTGLSGVHQTIRYASGTPNQRSTAWSAGATWLSQRSAGGTGLSSVPRGQWLAMVGFTEEGRKSGTVHCPMVHRTVWRAHGQKATKAYQIELKWLLGPLGL
jgi:hypothetical protein